MPGLPAAVPTQAFCFLPSLLQCEQSHLMREHEDVQERTTLRYEERITELHSIIAELNKKIDRLQGATIRYSSFLVNPGLGRARCKTWCELCSSTMMTLRLVVMGTG